MAKAMNKNTFSLTLSLLILLAGCRKSGIVSETVAVTYPRIELKGSQFVSINIGGSFTDPGAAMFDTFTGETTDVYPVKSDINNLKPGMYPIVYEGTNKYGFKSSAVRWVAVTSISTNEDISGFYLNTASNGPVNINKVARGIYRCDNIGGVLGLPDYFYNMYFVQLSDKQIHFPEQPGPFGMTRTDSEVLSKTSSDTTLTWRVLGPGFGTSIRTFSHQ